MTNKELQKSLNDYIMEMNEVSGTYEQVIINNLNVMNSILLNISKSLAEIADKLNEEREIKNES